MSPTQQNSASSCDASNTTERTVSSTTTSCCKSSSLSSSHTNSSISSSKTNDSTNNNNNNTKDTLHSESTAAQTALVPITCRGHFYHDTFFKEARQHFDAAVREVLDLWGQRSTLDDDLSNYRKLRESNLTETSQAVTTSEDEHCHQVVLDVKDFLNGDVKVKVVDDNELVVEGSVDHRQEDSVSKKSFLRRFSFPGLVKPEAVTSTMSSDGVLTITVPKKQQISTEDTDVQNINVLSSSSRNTNTTGLSTSSHHKMFREESPNVTKDSKTNVSITGKATNLATVKNINMSTGDTEKKSVTTEWENNSEDQLSGFLLPISHRGLFFQDPFFAEAHKEFEAAVKHTLNTWGETSVSDHMTCYRNLRARDLQEENQAVSLTEDQHSHKVVLDVKDFLSGDVKVKVVDENELVVEGSVDHRQEDSVSKKSFRRRFSFPGLVKPEAVTSTMSSDGVLTVTVPKKQVSRPKEAKELHNSVNKNSSLETSGNCSTSSHNSSSLNMTSQMQHKSRSKKDDSEGLNTEKKSCTSQKTENIHYSGDVRDDQTKTDIECGQEGIWKLDSFLPVSHRGLFFHDSFFQDVHQDFNMAVQEVLSKFRKEESSMDDLAFYRSLRESDLTEENQAIKVSENQHNHQMVLDVRDFMNGDVKVKVADKKEIIVEGRVEKQEGDSQSIKSFSRSLNLPEEVDLDTMTADVSSDGVLTITMPKVSKDVSMRTACQKEGTLQHSNISKKNYSHHEESSSQTKNEQEGSSCHTFTKSSTSHRRYVASSCR